MRAVFEYPLKLENYEGAAGRGVNLIIPCPFRILTIQDKLGHLTLWAEVSADPHENDNREIVTIVAFWTGEEMGDHDSLEYISSVQFYGGEYVLHFYRKLFK